MKKTDLIDVIKENVGISKKDAEKALTVALDAIINAVAAGKRKNRRRPQNRQLH